MNQAPPIGLIGTGLMGIACAKRMHAAGLELIGYDVDAKKLDAFIKLGGKPAQSVEEIARSCEKVVLAVFNTEQVEETVAALTGAIDWPNVTLTGRVDCRNNPPMAMTT